MIMRIGRGCPARRVPRSAAFGIDVRFKTSVKFKGRIELGDDRLKERYVMEILIDNNPRDYDPQVLYCETLLA